MAKIKTKKLKVKPLTLDTLLTVVEKSVGTKMFQTIYAEVDGQKKDITRAGDLSCAFFVSGVLSMFGLVDRLHSTVTGTVKALEIAGWKKTKNLEPGAVIVWGPSVDGSFTHDHLGFYLGAEEAVSNIWQKHVPGKHYYTFAKTGSGKYRPILAIYRHSKLK
ncbi:MAG: hypothetical protein A2589_02370 [Candidatus Vogelbacteria bacterium RIFOXYD1_FULL_46_19]|uniref:NlpC/P60 domain-containing protein n=1 Tax=Candidatus Vogelbacteria bacterium RIFOXYD1_FULL_46_19 TaxID=1802439 RepID=A0A1G2QHW0_9BACT|nr:MAG: hypothetical protein A2589_02370 [Candidatus Vogelbacteria bacterium RIFOXYD1_FULL_46_19]